MNHIRVGCHYCFQALKPDDIDDELHTFVRCQQCGRLYHSKCWNLSQPCIACNCTETVETMILNNPPMLPVIKLQATAIIPSDVSFSLDEKIGFVAPLSLIEPLDNLSARISRFLLDQVGEREQEFWVWIRDSDYQIASLLLIIIPIILVWFMCRLSVAF